MTSSPFITRALVALLVLVTGILAYLAWQMYQDPASLGARYHAVFLTSGDFYFGKLHTFPRLSLSDVYFLDRDASDPQAPYRLTKFSNALWGPGPRLDVNPGNVLWINALPDESPVARAIEAARLGRGAPASPPPTASDSVSAPSSTSSP